ncbi:hypothetical protein ACOMH4_18765 [Bacillus sp. YIM B13449]|uniref:hypothetical protein n=1 Tax=Bacillus sp. YIM B13449 TaxID=3366882 RepID=UPI003B78BE09
MRHFPKWMTLLVFGFIMIGYIVYQTMGSSHYNDLTKEMQDAAQIAATQNLDKSIRVDEEKVIIVESGFEKDFKRIMNKNQPGKVKNFAFSYLKTTDGFYKAIKVKVVDDKGSPFKIVFATDKT